MKQMKNNSDDSFYDTVNQNKHEHIVIKICIQKHHIHSPMESVSSFQCNEIPTAVLCASHIRTK